MRVYVIILAAVLVSTLTLDAVDAKSNTKQKSVESKNAKKPKKGAEAAALNVQEEKPVFEKARIRYTKPKSAKIQEETQPAKVKKQKKQKTTDPIQAGKNKYKQSAQEEVPTLKRSTKQQKLARSANDEVQEPVVPEHKVSKGKRAKRDVTVSEKEKLKKLQREEAGIEEQTEELVCPPCDCTKRGLTDEQYASNNAEEDLTTNVETEELQTLEIETEEDFQCDSLVEGCDV